MKPKNTRAIYLGPHYYWQFRDDWQPLNAIAKQHRLRFNKDLKRYVVPDATVMLSVLRALVEQGEPAERINVYDFETEELIPVERWQRVLAEATETSRRARAVVAEALGQKAPRAKPKPLALTFEPSAVRLQIPLTSSGKPRAEHAVLFGLAKFGCEAPHHDHGEFVMTKNHREAAEWLLAARAEWPEMTVTGLPRMPEQAAICSMVDGLFAHQKIGINFLTNRKKAILADDMGLGKSIQSILAAEQLKLDGRADYLLVICPVSLVPNWRRELAKWESSFGVSHVRIVPYSQLAKLKSVPPKTAVLIDEAHAIKRVESQRTQAIMRFTMEQEANIAALWLLTGTPVTRDNGDLWPLAHLVDHPVARLFPPLKLRSMRTDVENAMLAGAMKTHLLMRKKEDVLDLPPKIRQVVDVDTGVLGGSLEDIRALLKKNPEAFQEHLMRLKRMTAEAKSPATIAHVEEVLSAGRKVIVFSDHRESLHEIYDHFRKVGAHPVIIDGSVSDRDTPVQKFQNDAKCRVFVGNIRAAGVGLTLTAASDVVFNDVTWLPSDLLQAEDRCHRIGTRGTVNVYYMADSRMLIDSVMMKILANRSQEIASFEQSEQTYMDALKRWVETADETPE